MYTPALAVEELRYGAREGCEGWEIGFVGVSFGWWEGVEEYEWHVVLRTGVVRQASLGRWMMEVVMETVCQNIGGMQVNAGECGCDHWNRGDGFTVDDGGK